MSKKKKKAKKAKQIQPQMRYYDVNTQNPQYWKPVGSGNVSADGAVKRAGTQLRAIARSLDENLDLASGTLDTLVKKIIGAELQLIPAIRSKAGKPYEKLNRDIERLWLDFSKAPEVTGELSMAEMQRLVCRAWLRDGEMLAQYVKGTDRLRQTGEVNLSLELLEADYLPFDNDVSSSRRNVNSGVEKDTWGRPIAYHVYKEHPGSVDMDNIYNSMETKRVSALNMLHLKLVKRFRQTRGVTIFATVLRRFEDLKDLEESERIAARLNASMGAAITKSTEFAATNNDAEGNRSMMMQAGMIFDDLLPGEQIQMIGSERPNTEITQWRDGQLRAIATGTSTAYSAISQNYDGSYSSMRQELQDAKVNYEILRTQFINDFLNPIFEQFVQMANSQRLINLPAGADMNTVRMPQWSVPATPWIDPKKETEADILLIDNKIVSRGTVQRKMGLDPKAQQIEIDAEPKVEKQTPQTAAQPAVDDDTETEAA